MCHENRAAPQAWLPALGLAALATGMASCSGHRHGFLLWPQAWLPALATGMASCSVHKHGFLLWPQAWLPALATHAIAKRRPLEKFPPKNWTKKNDVHEE